MDAHPVSLKVQVTHEGKVVASKMFAKGTFEAQSASAKAQPQTLC